MCNRNCFHRNNRRAAPKQVGPQQKLEFKNTPQPMKKVISQPRVRHLPFHWQNARPTCLRPRFTFDNTSCTPLPPPPLRGNVVWRPLKAKLWEPARWSQHQQNPERLQENTLCSGYREVFTVEEESLIINIASLGLKGNLTETLALPKIQSWTGKI